MRGTEVDSPRKARSKADLDAIPNRNFRVADLVYIRLHGSEQLYVSGYSDREIEWWARRIEHWHSSRQPRDAKLIGTTKGDRRLRPVYVYFDNDAKVHAPFDAIRLATRLKTTTPAADHSARCGSVRNA